MFHRFFPVVLVLSVAVLLFSSISSSKQWFFIRSGLHDIYEMGFSGEYDSNHKQGLYEGVSYQVPVENKLLADLKTVLGENVSDDKRIEIDLTNQKLYAWDKSQLVYNFTISSGKPWWATPTGEFRTWIKLPYARMRGGSTALGTYYDLPNVPSVMYFYNEKIPKWKGYGIHGAYWHNNFGNPMSHGCVNLKIPDAAEVFNWAGVGTKVVVYGSTPLS